MIIQADVQQAVLTIVAYSHLQLLLCCCGIFWTKPLLMLFWGSVLSLFVHVGSAHQCAHLCEDCPLLIPACIF